MGWSKETGQSEPQREGSGGKHAASPRTTLGKAWGAEEQGEHPRTLARTEESSDGMQKDESSPESLVRDADPMKLVDLMGGNAQATHELQDQHGDTGGQQPTTRAEPRWWETLRAL